MNIVMNTVEIPRTDQNVRTVKISCESLEKVFT